MYCRLHEKDKIIRRDFFHYLSQTFLKIVDGPTINFKSSRNARF